MEGADNITKEAALEMILNVAKANGIPVEKVDVHGLEYYLALISREGAENFIKFITRNQDKIPSEVFYNHPELASRAVRKIYEEIGIIELLEKAGLKIRGVLTLSYTRIGRCELLGEVGGRILKKEIYLCIPEKDEMITKARKYFREKWEFKDNFGRIAELSAQHLVYMALVYKLERRDKGNIIKILILEDDLLEWAKENVGLIAERAYNLLNL